MEFNEKLQHLRKQHNMTQEQLAEKLYVTRAAVSKWESGKGYPNIESLKAISSLFAISIDELLSGNELLELAETENRSNLKRIYNIIGGVVDLLAIVFIFFSTIQKNTREFYLFRQSAILYRNNKFYPFRILDNLHSVNMSWNYETDIHAAP